MKCKSCKYNKAVWRTGSDGFAAKTGTQVCDNYSCRTWASGGYPVTFHVLLRPIPKPNPKETP